MSGYEFITCLNCGEENRVLIEKRSLANCGTCKEKLASGTLYDTLGIAKDADTDQVRQAYRKLAMMWHPDKNPDNVQVATARFKRISTAYKVLSNPSSRAQYDVSIKQTNNSSNTNTNNSNTDSSATNNSRSNASSNQSYTASEPEMNYTQAANMFVEEMYGIAIELAFQNNSQFRIAPALIEKGCPPAIAEVIARACVSYRKSVIRKAAIKPLIKAVIFVAIGGIITAATYNAASNGGTYLVAYGPIIYGGYQLLVGLWYLASGHVPGPKNLDA